MNEWTEEEYSILRKETELRVDDYFHGLDRNAFQSLNGIAQEIKFQHDWITDDDQQRLYVLALEEAVRRFIYDRSRNKKQKALGRGAINESQKHVLEKALEALGPGTTIKDRNGLYKVLAFKLKRKDGKPQKPSYAEDRVNELMRLNLNGLEKSLRDSLAQLVKSIESLSPETQAFQVVDGLGRHYEFEPTGSSEAWNSSNFEGAEFQEHKTSIGNTD